MAHEKNYLIKEEGESIVTRLSQVPLLKMKGRCQGRLQKPSQNRKTLVLGQALAQGSSLTQSAQGKTFANAGPTPIPSSQASTQSAKSLFP